MLDPRSRSIRLKQDYQDLLRLRGPVFDFEAFVPPAPERYILKYSLKSVMGLSGTRPIYSRDGYVHELELRLSPGYYDVLTNDDIWFRTQPVFHPNVFPSGHICVGGYNPTESLARFIIRIAKFIQFDPAVINAGSPANVSARDWYLSHRGLCPVDRSPLPELEPRKLLEFGPPRKDKTLEFGPPRRYS